MQVYLSWLVRLPVLCHLALLAVGDSKSDLLSSAGGVYDSSTTPSHLAWNTYNYCNAPHVNAEHYFKPANVPHAKLVYMNAVIRHHKVRTTEIDLQALSLIRGPPCIDSELQTICTRRKMS